MEDGIVLYYTLYENGNIRSLSQNVYINDSTKLCFLALSFTRKGRLDSIYDFDLANSRTEFIITTEQKGRVTSFKSHFADSVSNWPRNTISKVISTADMLYLYGFSHDNIHIEQVPVESADKRGGFTINTHGGVVRSIKSTNSSKNFGLHLVFKNGRVLFFNYSDQNHIPLYMKGKGLVQFLLSKSE